MKAARCKIAHRCVRETLEAQGIKVAALRTIFFISYIVLRVVSITETSELKTAVEQIKTGDKLLIYQIPPSITELFAHMKWKFYL